MRFSFIIPVYNCEKYLLSCIESLLAVNLNENDYEILLIDDGSIDGTARICDELAEKHSQIHVVHQQNSGVSAARNRGIQEARGDYLLFIDSDDTVNADKLSRILNDSRCTETDMTVFGMSFDYYHCGKCYRQDKLFYEYDGIMTSGEWGNDFLALFRKNSLSAIWNKIFRKDIIIKNSLHLNKTMFLYEDLDFVLRYMAHCGTIWNVPEAVYHYRQSEDEGNANRRIKRLTSVNAFIQPIETSMDGLAGIVPAYERNAILHELYLCVARGKVSVSGIPDIRKLSREFNEWSKNHELPLTETKFQTHLQKERALLLYLNDKKSALRHWIAVRVKALLKRFL